MDFQPCEMNGGRVAARSFFHESNGAWIIVGVNNRGVSTSETDPARTAST